MSGYRVEYWREGTYLGAVSASDLGQARALVILNRAEHNGTHAIITYPRTESEREAS